MKSVIVVTGDCVDMIESSSRKFVENFSKKMNLQEKQSYILYRLYPENGKHINVWSQQLRKNLKSDTNTTFVIHTFSEDVLSLLGHMIYKGELNTEIVYVVVATETGEINAKFNEEGFLEGFPFGYLSLNMD